MLFLHTIVKKNAGKKDNPEWSGRIAIEKFSWSNRQKKLVEQTFCLSCWCKHNFNRLIPSSKKNTAGAIAIDCKPVKPIVLAHMLFDTTHGWKRVESMQHPTLELTVSIKADHHPQ